MSESASQILQDRYLRFMLQMSMTKPSTKFLLVGGTTVQGQFQAVDSESNRFRVNDLQSPTGFYQRAIVRGSDVVLLEADLPQRS